ncbi:hypothetical protein HY642_04195 [Candidatus Woesearchaeota archaeon]|nr:hypothetical protein [Candidatus Woesearchaeota archaeon]
MPGAWGWVLVACGAVILAGCTTGAVVDQQFKDACTSAGKMFMYMPEMREGHVIGNGCHGCMVDDKTHVCDIEEYERLAASPE